MCDQATMVHTVLNILISIIWRFFRPVSNFACQTFAARGRVELGVILQDVNIASRHRNQNNSSLYMFHSFLIMRYLFLKIYSLNRLKKRFLKTSLIFLMHWLITPCIDGLGSGRTGLTKFVWPFEKSWQKLSLPNFQFVKRGRTKTQQNICFNHKCQSRGNKHHRLRTVRENGCICSQESWAHGNL